MVSYEKKLNYYDLLFASIGHIIGAGIFFLIKYVYGYAQEKTWMSIFLGGLFMLIFGNLYANLPKKYNVENIEQHILKEKIGINWSNIILIITVLGFIFGGYIVGDAFASYFSNTINISHEISFLLLIGVCYLLNIYKIDILANFNNFITVIGIGLLILLILIGFYKIIIDKTTDFKKYYTFGEEEDYKTQIWNIIKGAYLIIFSYLGFEVMVKLNKESKNPSYDIPRSIKHSLYITIIIYTLFGIVYAYSMNLKSKYKKNSDIPITNSLEILVNTNKYNYVVNIAACIFTANTVLISMLGASRLLDDVINIDPNHNIPRKSILIITVGILILFWLKYSIKNSTFISNTFTLLLFGSVLLADKNII
jgi:amino acid transporter